MSQPVTVRAQMQDGTIVTEHVCTFDQFVAVVLPLRRDPACSAVRWHADDDPTTALAIREEEVRTLAAIAGRRRAEAIAVA